VLLDILILECAKLDHGLGAFQHTRPDVRAVQRGGNMAQEDVREVLISINKTCEITGLGRSKIYDLLRVGKLEAVKCGRRTLLRSSVVDAFIDALPKAVGKGGQHV
jgi:excisionase family DNA binding protein